ncbi:coiled-coil domain-containing protein 113 isoform X1 [Rhinatrema bivittatum]|uniref:coiled-coil domain-containing protein 113 isoform X1 n=1 Tax=Rhinatrema bivittatum TaxID=194408 RepID=UPI001125B3A3|nr:coiled-coil domain-containing protein 113 isoform X1 [Rhinatrema bivittatum]
MADTETESVKTDSQTGEDLGGLVSELSIEHLRTLIEQTSNAIEVLKAEVDMLEKVVKRIEPKDLAPQPTTDLKMSSAESREQTRARRRSRSRSTTERLNNLTAEQKCTIAQQELEEMKQDIEKLHQNSERTLRHLKATMDEAEIRWAEIKKSSYEFERDIGKAMVQKKTPVTAEKLMRYLDEKTRSRDMLADKLRLKNTALKVQKKKLMLQMKQKEEMGEVLHEVDFQQLKIENTQFLDRIDERNQDLLQLKLTAGNTLQILCFYKEKLQNMTLGSNCLAKEISLRQEMLQKIEGETELVEEERAKAECLNKKLQKQLSDYRVPDVFEYVNKKIDHGDLEKSVKVWERKVEIAEMSIKTYRKAWEQMKTANTQLQPFVKFQVGQSNPEAK